MTADELEAIRARAEAATPGPWIHEPQPASDVVCDTHGGVIANCEMLDDAHFIAGAREDIPALLAEVERLQRYIQSTGGDTVAPDAFTHLERIVHDQAREIERLRAENSGLRMDLIDTRDVLKTLPPGWLHGETGQDD